MPHLELSKDFSIWSDFALRSTGFAYKYLEPLIDLQLITLTSNLSKLELRYKQSKEELLNEIALTLSNSNIQDKKPLRKLKKKYLKNNYSDAPEPINLICLYKKAFEMQSEISELKKEIETHYDQKLLENRTYLQNLVTQSKFRKALIWQNHKVLEKGLDKFGQNDPSLSNKQVTQKENLIISYLQRYSTKNETIGFFGPLAWGTFNLNVDHICFNIDQGLIRDNFVHFEFWAIKSFSSALANIPNVQNYLEMRLSTRCHIAHESLFRNQEKIIINPKYISILKLIKDGISKENLIKYPFVNNNFHVDEIEKLISFLKEKNIVSQKFYLGLHEKYDEILKEQISLISDPVLKNNLLSMLAQFFSYKNELKNFKQDPSELHFHIKSLENYFESVTKLNPTNFDGKNYAGRSLIYEDCIRNVNELHLGSHFINRIKKPLSLVMSSSRWLSQLISNLYKQELLEVIKKYPLRKVPCSWIIQNFHKGKVYFKIANKAKFLHAQKWETILKIPSSEKSLSYRHDDLINLVVKEFQADFPAWPAAKYICPDLLVAAKNKEDFVKGNYTVVLGEIHMGANMLAIPSIMNTHPNKSSLKKDLINDIPFPTFNHSSPKSLQGSRMSRNSSLEKDIQLLLDDTTQPFNKKRHAPISHFYIDKEDPSLKVKDSTTKNDIPWELFLEHLMKISGINSYKLTHSKKHLPRIEIDNLIIQRETWFFNYSELPFIISKKTSYADFISSSNWIKAQSMPNQIFIKIPGELKPIYIDFRAPKLMIFFCKLLHKAQLKLESDFTITFSEMLPNQEEAWLTDAESQAYFSEFRIVAFDKAAYSSH